MPLKYSGVMLDPIRHQMRISSPDECKEHIPFDPLCSICYRQCCKKCGIQHETGKFTCNICHNIMLISHFTHCVSC